MVKVKQVPRLLHNKICKGGIILLIAIIFSVLVEMAFNYHAIIEPYAEMDIFPMMEIKEDEGIYKVEFEEARYINKFRIRGEFEKDTSYTLDLTVENDFGKEESLVINDRINDEFQDAFTNINKRVKTLKMKITNAKSVSIEQIAIKNEKDINKFRLLLVFVTILLIEIVVLNKTLLTDKLEYFFGIYALGIGLLMIIMAGPIYTTWDEEIHFGNVYMMLQGKNAEWSEAAWKLNQKLLPVINTKEERYMLCQYMNEKEEVIQYNTEKESQFVDFSKRAYYPMALFWTIAKKIGLSFTNSYMLGKLGNLLLYIIFIWLSIHWAVDRKILIFSIAMLPTSLFQASMYTYDGVVFSMIMLGFVLLMNEFVDNRHLCALRLFFAVLLIVVGSFSKAIYIPLLLVIFALPNTKFISRKQAYAFKICCLIIFFIMMSSFVMPVLTNTIEGNLSYGGDARGGDTGTVRQVMSMLQHPIDSIKMIIYNITTLDNFRNLGDYAKDNYLATNLLSLNFASLGVIKDEWSYILIPLLFMLFFVSNEDGVVLQNKAKLWYFVMIMSSVVLIWLALYLSFTPVGDTRIAGVQARYYLPLLFPISYITRTKTISCKLSHEKYNACVVILNSILMFQCMYQLFINGRCA